MHRIRSGFLTLAATASIILGASIAATPATAASVQFNFSGLVSFVDIPLGSVFAPTQVVSGTYTFDTTTPNSGPSGIGRYDNAVITPVFHLFVDSREYSLGNSGSNFVQIQQLGADDIYTVRTPLTAVSPFPGIVNQFSPLAFQVEFQHTPTVFSGGVAPPTLGSLFSVPSATFHVIFANGSITRDVVGTLAMTPVPLPPAVILFGAGLVALIGLGARNWQRKTVGGMRLEV